MNNFIPYKNIILIKTSITLPFYLLETTPMVINKSKRYLNLT